MAKHDDLVRVGHMLDAAKSALDLLGETDRSTFDADRKLQLALVYLLQTVGEAAYKISPTFHAEHPAVPWGAITSMRHRLVHDYVTVDFDVVWKTTTVSVPALIPLLEAILADAGQS